MTARAPGRVNLIGDHTDYNGGLCLPFAVPLVTTTTARGRGDDRLRIRTDAFPEGWTGRLGDVTLDGREAMPDWVRYVAGVLWAGLEDGWPLPGLDLVVASDIPLGSGLSSSAALECSVALAVAAWSTARSTPAAGSRSPSCAAGRRRSTSAPRPAGWTS